MLGTKGNCFNVDECSSVYDHDPKNRGTMITEKNMPIISEKPFLSYDKYYEVVVPATKISTSGAADFNSEYNSATKIPVIPDNFYVALPSDNETKNIQNALDSGKNILLTPGIYSIKNTLKITHSNTIMLGIGMATLTADSTLGNTPLIQVTDQIDGVKIAGLILTSVREFNFFS